MPLIIFDIDGTLVDSETDILAAQRAAFAALGLSPPARDASLAVVGLSLYEAFHQLVGPQGPIEPLTIAYKEAWHQIRANPSFREQLYPGAGALVAELADRPDVSLGIATGKSRLGVKRILASQGWETVFQTIQTADTHPSKPNPSMIRAALAETDTTPQDSIMIGDTTFDVEMARSAGVQAIGVSWGFHPAPALSAAGAARVVQDFAELRRALLDLVEAQAAFHV